jgi:ferrochelatase
MAVNGNAKKTAVVLLNLGGPDEEKYISPFLFNFFRDKNIINLPAVMRYPLAAFIAARRGAREAKKSYAHIGFKSPLLKHTTAQKEALEFLLNKEGQGAFKCFICFIAMRYWHPFAAETAEAVKAWNPDHIVLLPLYPQYSTTTTASSFQNWKQAADKAGLNVKTSSLCCYPCNDGFIEASANLIRKVWGGVEAQANRKNLPAPQLLFSAHGLPQRIVDSGDPYVWQCEESARAIAHRLGIEDWRLCYQSKVGRLRWIGPSTIEALKDAGAQGRPVVLYPHAFVSEHVETLVELDIEYGGRAARWGIPIYARAPTVGTHDAFIGGLARMVLDCAGGEGVSPDLGSRMCPPSCKRCALEGPKQPFTHRR